VLGVDGGWNYVKWAWLGGVKGHETVMAGSSIGSESQRGHDVIGGAAIQQSYEVTH